MHELFGSGLQRAQHLKRSILLAATIVHSKHIYFVKNNFEKLSQNKPLDSEMKELNPFFSCKIMHNQQNILAI